MRIARLVRPRSRHDCRAGNALPNASAGPEPPYARRRSPNRYVECASRGAWRVRTRDVRLIPPIRRAILQRHDLRVHVVRHGNREEQQYQGEADGAPFSKAVPELPRRWWIQRVRQAHNRAAAISSHDQVEEQFGRHHAIFRTRNHYSSMAERVGFEPTVEFPQHSLSRRAPSTTRTPLRVVA